MPRQTANTSRRNQQASNVDSLASVRKFGVEIEFVGISVGEAVTALDNAGVPVDHRNSGNYNHATSESAWKVVTDSSVIPGPGQRQSAGGELVSPILSGIGGLDSVRKAVKALSDAGATVNRSCGLHVHVDARDLTGQEIACVVKRYVKFESKIDQFMPRSRRGDGNTYCQSTALQVLGNRAQTALSSPSPNIRDIVRALSDRFQKLNVQAYNAHGTLEFRHHSGTVNVEKVVNWIKFCVNFVEVSKADVAAAAVVPASPTARRAASGSGRAQNGRGLLALHAIVNRLQSRASGEPAEVLGSVAGVSTSTAVVYISNLRTQYGFSIKKNLVTGRYFIVRNGNLPALADGTTAGRRRSVNTRNILSTATAAEVPDDTAFRGLPVSITNYYEERIQDLAS